MPDGKRIFRFYRPVLSTKFPFPRRVGMMSPVRPSHNLNVPSAGKHLFPLFIVRSEVSTRLGTGLPLNLSASRPNNDIVYVFLPWFIIPARCYHNIVNFLFPFP